MRHVARVFPIMAAAALLTGCGADTGGGVSGVAASGAGFVPLSELRSLPEGHPPLRGYHPALPEGHPPLSWQHPALPEGHPPVYQSQPKCPAGTGTRQPRLEQYPAGQPEAHGLIST
jgi:hypothetical protein